MPEPEFDDATPAQLRAALGEEEFAQLARMFRANAVAMADAFKTAVDAGQAEDACRAVHKLKSSARIIGARALAELSQRLEGMTRDGTLDGAPAQATALSECVARALRWVDSLQPS